MLRLGFELELVAVSIHQFTGMGREGALHHLVNRIAKFFSPVLGVCIELGRIEFYFPHFGTANVEHTIVIEELVIMIEGKNMSGESIFIPARSGVVPKETPFPAGTFAVEQGGEEADSVDWILFGYLGLGEVGEGWIEVGGIDEVGSDGTRGDCTRPVGHQWNPNTGLEGGGFSSLYGFAFEHGRNLKMGAIIGIKEHEGIFTKTEFIKPINQAADQFVHIGDHIGKEFELFRLSVFGIFPLRGVGSGHHGPVRQSHGVVQKHRILSIPFHEIEQEIDRAVGAVFSGFFCDQGSVPVISGIGVTGAFLLGVPGMIEAIFIKPGLIDMHTFTAAAVGVGEVGWIVGLKLPLSGYAGAVARLFHQVTKGFFAGIKDAEIGPVSMVVFPGHDLHTGGRAKGLRVGVSKPHSLFGECVDVGSGVGSSPVATESIDSDIVGHDQ